MTSFTHYRERSRDINDFFERHVFGKQEYIKNAGSIVKVRGTGSDDEEVMVMNVGGVSFNVKEKFNTEVMLLSGSSDTTLKMALLTIPKDKQRRWEEGHGGVQHPTDDTFALDFSDSLAHLTQNKFAVGEKGEFEVKGDTIYMRAKNVVIEGELTVNKFVRTDDVVRGKKDIPGFEGSKQAEAKEDDDA